MEKKSTLPPERFSSFTKKRVGLVLVVIIALFISNELFFRWAKPLGVSENDIYDLSGLWVVRPSGYGKTLPISAIAFDSLDNLWVGRKADVTVIRPDGSSKTYEISGGELTSLAVDSHDQVWIGGGFGLRRLTQRGIWQSVSSLAGKRVGRLAADNQGQLWVTTAGRISRLSDDDWTHFPTGSVIDDLLLVEILSSAVDVDEHGRVWSFVQYSSMWGHGLSVCDKNTGKCSVYRSNISAARPSVTMAFDNNNRLWVTHSTGIRVVDVDRLLSVSFLYGLLIFRLVLSVLFFLIGYFFIVRLSDTRKEKTIPEYLTTGDVLKRVWVPLVLLGLVGPVLFVIAGAFDIRNDTQRTVLCVIIVIIGALVTLIRARSLMVNHHISKEGVVSSTVWGGLITFVCTIPIFIAYLLLRSLGQ